MIDTTTFWIVSFALGLGTWLMRFSFLGIFGNRSLPDWAETYMRYVGAAVLPALVVPMVMWPMATDGQTDPARIIAAAAALYAALRYGVMGALIAGMGVLWASQWLIGLIG